MFLICAICHNYYNWEDGWHHCTPSGLALNLLPFRPQALNGPKVDVYPGSAADRTLEALVVEMDAAALERLLSLGMEVADGSAFLFT